MPNQVPPPRARFWARCAGLPLAVGSFISPRNTDETIAAYHGHFVPSKWLEKPLVKLALFALCAETEERARALRSPMEAWLVEGLLRKMNIPFPSTRDALSATYDASELSELACRGNAAVVGTPEQVATRLGTVVADGRLIAEACGLAPAVSS
ncbi:MAG TPA: hypothetical protein VNO21_13945 [Polyangiaceae bacterium]|nr:hypothetical protein [Polyangiaceae bacterium]